MFISCFLVYTVSDRKSTAIFFSLLYIKYWLLLSFGPWIHRFVVFIKFGKVLAISTSKNFSEPHPTFLFFGDQLDMYLANVDLSVTHLFSSSPFSMSFILYHFSVLRYSIFFFCNVYSLISATHSVFDIMHHTLHL